MTVAPASFEALAAEGEGMSVVLGAALLARDVYPETDIAALLGRLDELAAPLSARGFAALGLRAQGEALAAHLHGEHGFRGNAEEYDDPRNSLLPDVLSRRTGLPIALSLVYLEVANRAGARASGVGFPGRFLVRLDDDPADLATAVFLDPFAGGRILDEDGIRELFYLATHVDEPNYIPPYLVAVKPRAMLLRWLTNLAGAYLKRAELSRALVVLDRIATLCPGEAKPLRDRGLLALQLGAPAAALADLERVVAIDPHGELGDEARGVILALRTLPDTRN